ncbi:type I restriction enzyme HsdR N-terminal domain-containing protein [Apibacter muscae]|uniref:Type I restriction enzyme HsdR N-terminal domain-containing protein n=1 Tax=Apibacter muscae TaxID=2509004 RepID=A0A563DFU1_9FLAO|nr:type I restriction enzyme HsdR N-terminal domain-containing protein [Apibacter muscae]TWP28654.1 type I restriction enzyme HsdR N-terminal domain-containing protein [Apibacter muscae]
MELSVLNFPEKYEFQIKEKCSLWYIFDEVRKKWLILTPEEWVRQNVIKYLQKEKKIPKSAYLIERRIQLNNQVKRLDLLILKKTEPFLLVECKAPEISISEAVFEQAARYNLEIKAPYLLLTNGLNHLYFYYDIHKNEYSLIEKFNY